MFFQSSVVLQARKVSSEERAGAEDRLPKMSPKFAAQHFLKFSSATVALHYSEQFESQRR